MTSTLELKITGMTCDHCVRSVTEALKDVPGVAAATVNLEGASAVVEGDNLDLETLAAAVAEEGYTAALK